MTNVGDTVTEEQTYDGTHELTSLQEQGARLMATYPHLSKAELARKLKCSRKSIVNWMKKPAFVEKVQELQKVIRPNIRSLIDAMTKTEKAEFLKKLQRKHGTYLPEIWNIERILFNQTTGQFNAIEKSREAIFELQKITMRDVELQSINDLRHDVERLEEELDRKSPGWRHQQQRSEDMSFPGGENSNANEIDDADDKMLVDYLEDQRPDYWEDENNEMEENEWYW